MISRQSTTLVTRVLTCLLASFSWGIVSPAWGGVCFTFTGAADNDFFNVANWDDGIGGNPTAIVDPVTMEIEQCLQINGSAVQAAAAVEFGSGSLMMMAGAMLEVTSGEVNFNAGSMLNMADSSIQVTGGTAGQFNLNSGSTGFITGNSTVIAADDITFRGNATLNGATVTSTGDDVEFWETGTLNISNSNFTTDPGQVTFFKDAASGSVSYNLTDSTITTGRVSIENEVFVTLLDSIINADGDIEEALDGNSTNPGTLILNGNSSATADQIEHSIRLILNDTSRATFTDDNDADGDSWILNDSSVTLNTVDNLLTIVNSFVADARSDVFDGRSNLSYAANPSAWDPSTWNGLDAVQLSLVPEPSGWLLLGMAGMLLTRRR